jgi:hypothetical protein
MKDAESVAPVSQGLGRSSEADLYQIIRHCF